MVQGRVRIIGSVPVASGGVSVQLESDNPAVAPVPSSVSISPGAAESQPFTINPKAVATPTPVTITATLTPPEGGTQQERSVGLLVQPPEVSSVAVNPTAVIGKTASVQGTVTLNGPAPPGGTSIALSSANPAIVNVPASVIVPAGSTTAQFTVNTEPVNTEPVGSATPVIITASGQGIPQTTTLSVQPPALTQFTLNPTSVTGGATPQGTVQLNGPAPTGFAVTLQNNNPSAATVQGNVTVPANSTSATFPVSTLPVTSTSQANIVASRGVASIPRQLTVQPPVLSAYTLLPSPINAGQNSVGTITLSGPAPSGTQVALSGSNANTADFPATIPVPANNTQVAFNATGRTFTDGDRSVAITATYLGVPRPSPPSLTVRRTIQLSNVAVNPNSVVARTSAQGTITLTGPAPAGGVSVTLSSSNSAIVKVPTSPVTVTAGNTTAQFTVNTEPVSGSAPIAFTITASTPDGVQRTATLNVQPPTPSNFTFNRTAIGGGESSTGTITLNGPAPSGTSVSLSRNNTNTANVPASVTVPTNATQVTFTATGLFFTSTTNRTVTVTASYHGVSRTANLTVQGEPPEPPPEEPKDETDFASFEMLTAEGPRSAGGTAATDEEGTGHDAEEAPASGRPFIQREELPRVSADPTAKPINEQPK